MNETVYDDTSLNNEKNDNNNELNKDKKVKVVIEKNYKARNFVMSLFSLPMLLLISTALVVPVLLLGSFTFSTGLILTIVAEIIVVFIALT